MNGTAIPLLFFSLFSGELKTVDIDVAGSRYVVEIADTALTQMRGLMGRQGLGENAGMLFVYEEDRHVQFWMKGVTFPLDMIFFSRCGEIVKIHDNAQPDSSDIVSSSVAVRVVLELRGGASKRAEMRLGDRVSVKGDVFDACD